MVYKISSFIASRFSPMATAPVKPKNLHNFSLPCLKWAHKNSTHRHRRLSDSSHNPSPQPDSEPHDPNHPLNSPNKQQSDAPETEETCDEDSKPWKLRPRKSVAQIADNGTGEPSCAEAPENEKSKRVRGNSEGVVQKSERREKKSKLWVSLSREEIEEDVYSMTGSKPSRRPKKRTKTQQKQLDNVFPGLYLAGTSVDSYRVQFSA